ncbi:DUF2470 domain-containing protein [Streptomyces sp. 6N223]|uniref:DUF2470 domain-containing protein n=1 Tax=Streptomyces sp. 6N223 TaxID=3457412 RepID=UPI003FD0D820
MIRPGSPVRQESQPRPEGPEDPADDAREPTAAERVRTLVESNASATLTIPGAGPGTGPGPQDQQESCHGVPESRAVAPSGDVYLLLPADAPAARAAAHARGDELTAVMEITDVAPVAVPHRIRGRAWVAGWLTALAGTERAAALRLLARRHPTGPVPGPHWTPLRLEVGEAYADDLWGADHVEPGDFAAAAADPLARHEAELLQHLAAAHEAQLRSLCALVGDGEDGCEAWQRVVPLGLDRFGLRVRFCAEGLCRDARFEFPEPVADIAGLRRAMRLLFEGAARQ